jgi:hypothetical protein
MSLQCLRAQYIVVLILALLTAALAAKGWWSGKLDALRGGATMLGSQLIMSLCVSGLIRGGPIATVPGWVAFYLANYGATFLFITGTITLKLDKYVRAVNASAARLRGVEVAESSAVARETALALASMAFLAIAIGVAIFVCGLWGGMRHVTFLALEFIYSAVLMLSCVVYVRVFLGRLNANLAFAISQGDGSLEIMGKLKQIRRKVSIVEWSITCLARSSASSFQRFSSWWFPRRLVPTWRDTTTNSHSFPGTCRLPARCSGSSRTGGGATSRAESYCLVVCSGTLPIRTLTGSGKLFEPCHAWSRSR